MKCGLGQVHSPPPQSALPPPPMPRQPLPRRPGPARPCLWAATADLAARRLLQEPTELGPQPVGTMSSLLQRAGGGTPAFQPTGRRRAGGQRAAGPLSVRAVASSAGQPSEQPELPGAKLVKSVLALGAASLVSVAGVETVGGAAPRRRRRPPPPTYSQLPAPAPPATFQPASISCLTLWVCCAADGTPRGTPGSRGHLGG